jgi:UDP-GlcNAc:undecaprenyl-phosphate GlcNAc-1-phosphate transferase
MFNSNFLTYFSGIALVAFFLSLALSFLALFLFPKIGFVDRPHLYGLTRAPIPYYGGLVLFATFLVSVLIFLPLTPSLIGLLIGSFLIVLVGFFDDLFDIRPKLRLIVQFIAALVLVFSGVGILSINIPWFGSLDLDYPNWGFTILGLATSVGLLGSLFTVFWIMTIVNTMNFLDGISGLTSGITFIASMTLFFLSIHPGIHAFPASQVTVASLALILAVASLAFWFFDFSPPRILMGDTGSTFLGFVLATLAIFSGGKVATAFLVLGIPILDMVWVVLRRIFEGKKFWVGDMKHLHHRLMDLGLSKRLILFVYYLISIIFGIFAILFVSSEQKLFMLIALVVLMTLLAIALVFIPSKKKE